jgi:hypothetical protein
MYQVDVPDDGLTAETGSSVFNKPWKSQNLLLKMKEKGRGKEDFVTSTVY